MKKIDKHILVLKEDSDFISQLINNNEISNFTSFIHEAVVHYKQNKDINQIIEILSKISKKQKDMSIEQSTMSEYISDYLYGKKYHGDAINVNFGTDTPGYRSAKKLAIKHLKENQENHSKKVNHAESVRNRQERMSQSNAKIILK